MNAESAALVFPAITVFLIGLEKGGFPVGALATPLLIVCWPNQQEAARQAIGFVLPLLCVADIAAAAMYRREIDWKIIRPLLPATLVGIVLGSLMALPRSSQLPGVLSESALKGVVGALGLAFIAYKLASRWIRVKLEHGAEPGRTATTVYGLFIGLTSALAHAAGPLMQMYLLPRRLPNVRFAATSVGFFLIVNLLKVPPFLLSGRITRTSLERNLVLLPALPIGLFLGWWLVRRLRPEHYQNIIYLALAVTSATLLWKAF